MLPPGFIFSQGSLQDYVDCRRRFQLKYVLAQPWPAVEVEPALEREQYGIQGRHFHQLLERYYLGISQEVVAASAQEMPLRDWWRAFLDEPPLNLPQGKQLPEVRFTISLAGQHLVGIFDLLAMDLGRRMVIVDWKTGRWRPPREMMEQRLQTRVYPFVAVEAGTHLFGEAVDPARVTMSYWFANHPTEPHVFHYDADQHEQNRQYFSSLIEEILANDDLHVAWPLTADERRCGYCVYRSLCDRGVSALEEFSEEFSDLDEGDELPYVLDLGDVDEIAY